jgi:hypothetical protein
MSRGRLYKFALGVCLGALGCYPVTNVCDQRLQVQTVDGGALGCVRPEDCPRGSETIVCNSDGTALHQCVSCDTFVCVLHVPVPCQ